MKRLSLVRDDTTTLLIFLLLNDTIRKEILGWQNACVDRELMVGRIKHFAYSNLPEIPDDIVMAKFWRNTMHTTLQGIDWDKIITQLLNYSVSEASDLLNNYNAN